MSSTEVPGLDWSAKRLLPAFQMPQHLTVYDIRKASSEIQLSVTTLAGLINRPQPQVYLLVNDDDVFWLKEAFGFIPSEQASQSNDDVLEAMLQAYHDTIKGVVIYNPDFIDSINIATMVGAQRDGIVVSPMQAESLAKMHELPVIDDMRQYAWQSRLQAYDWAREHLLPACSQRLVAGIDPKNATGLRAFLVATRTFMYYLDPRHFFPHLSNHVHSERQLMQDIFKAFPAGSTHLGWFIDEVVGVNLTSEAAIAVLATDNFYNMEVWAATQFVPLPLEIVAVPEDDTLKRDDAKIYLSFTISDGDNLQYLQHRMRQLWNDPARGSIPLGWTISPVVKQALPALAQYYMNTATPDDQFIAGPSGAGYMFPSRWPEEHLSAFLQRTGELMQDMDISILEVLDVNFLAGTGIPFISSLGQMGMCMTEEKLQRRFAEEPGSWDICGILHGSGKKEPEWNFYADNVPVYQNVGLAGSVRMTVNLIKNATAHKEKRPLFLNVYILAWSMTPSDLKQVVAQLGDEYEVVIPGTLLNMLAQSQSES